MRETMRYETLAASAEEQLAIEGEAALPGSMRDAVTVLSVQTQANIEDVQAGMGEALLRGRARFQVLYTQGDLTRVRSLETTCDFERAIRLDGALPGMRMEVRAAVQEADGSAASGRICLRALLLIAVDAFEIGEKTLIARAGEDADLRVQSQQAAWCLRERFGEETTLVREEKELPARLGAGEALSATATAGAAEIVGGSGRIGVTGTVTVRVLHLPQEAGEAMVTTTHELPYEVSIAGQLPGGALVTADAEVTDVLADCTAGDKRRLLRLEVQLRVRVTLTKKMEGTFLRDLYTLSGEALEPVTETIALCTAQEEAAAQESTRLQVTLPREVPPMDKILCAFVQPVLTGVTPAGRRLDAEGLMGVTLIYLPQDSNIPYSVHVREPFAMTFPLEMGEGVTAQVYAVESSAEAVTSDRAQVRCILELRAMHRSVKPLIGVAEVRTQPQTEQTHGFILVWPDEGETRWETARRLRVPEEALKPAGKRALLAFRR